MAKVRRVWTPENFQVTSPGQSVAMARALPVSSTWTSW